MKLERDELVEVIYHNLLHIRKTLNMSGKDFGSMIGVTRQTINNIEAGRRKLSVTQCLAILYVLEHEIFPKLDYEKEMCIRDMCNRKVINSDYIKSLTFEKEEL